MVIPVMSCGHELMRKPEKLGVRDQSCTVTRHSATNRNALRQYKRVQEWNDLTKDVGSRCDRGGAS